MEAEHYMDNFGTVRLAPKQVVGDQDDAQSSAFTGKQVLKQRKSVQVERLDEQVVGLSLQEHATPSCRARPTNSPRQSQVQSRPIPNPIPLKDCTNTATKSNSHASIRTWKKLAREPGITVPNSFSMVVDRRPCIDVVDMREGKKICMVGGSSHDKENMKVVVGS